MQQDHNGRAEAIHALVGGSSKRNSLPGIVPSRQEAQWLEPVTMPQDVDSDPKSSPGRLRRMPHRNFIENKKRKSRSADALRDMAHRGTISEHKKGG